ncbi:MAG: GtrA family protein, partial [Nocardioides sp.]
RFMAVGAIATLVAVLLYNWLAYEPQGLWSPLHRHITLSYIVSHGVGMLVSYELSRRWTFKERSERQPGEGFLSYAIINILTMVTIPVGCLWVSRHWLGYTSGLADNLSGNVVGLLISQVARFYLFRRFVFKRPIHYIEVYDDPHALSEAEPGSSDGHRDGSRAPSTSDRVS